MKYQYVTPEEVAVHSDEWQDGFYHGLRQSGSKIERTTKGPAKDVICQLVCNYFDTTMEAIVVRSRKRAVVFPRQILITLLRDHCKMGVVNLGVMFQRDHTSVIHSVKAIKDLYDVDQDTRNAMNYFENEILQLKALAIPNLSTPISK